MFDWGGVLAGGAGELDLTVVEQRLGVPPGSLPGLMGVDPYETDPDNVWHQRELGAATALEWAHWYFDRVRAAGGQPVLSPDAMVAAEPSRWTLPCNDVVVDTVHRLHAEGYRLAICTNNVSELADVWRNGLPLNRFDVIAASCELGQRKPDPAMFDHVTEQLGVAPASTVLLDDNPTNTAGARKAGRHTVLVGADHGSAIADLSRLLGTPPRHR